MQLPSTLVFDYPTVAALSEFLGSKLGGSPAAGSAAHGNAAAAPAQLGAAALALTRADGSGTPLAVVVLGTAWRAPQAALARLALPGGLDVVGRVPHARWDLEADPLAARFGAYLSDVASFDAAAFGVSDAEAALMDPQQRLLLECVGEAALAHPVALEAAPLRSRGVYVGAFPGGRAAHLRWRTCIRWISVQQQLAHPRRRPLACLSCSLQAWRPPTMAPWRSSTRSAAPSTSPRARPAWRAAASATPLACAAPASVWTPPARVGLFVRAPPAAQKLS